LTIQFIFIFWKPAKRSLVFLRQSGMKKYYISFFSLLIIASACQHKAVPVITARTVDPTAPAHPVQNVKADAMAGRTIFQEHCGKCHALPDPAQYTGPRWEGILQRMVPKAKLNETEAASVKAYLLSAAAR
jgi:hypothetical protein